MRTRRGLGLSAAAVAWLCFIPGAFAAGSVVNPNFQLNFSAESVALPPGNRVTLNGGNLAYQVLGATGIPNNPPAVTVTFSAPTADTFANPGGALCQWFGAVTVTTPPTVSGNTIVCTNPAAGGPFTFLNLTNPGATGAITLTGPDV